MASCVKLVAVCFLLAYVGYVFGEEEIKLSTKELGRIFDGIGGISGGGATSKLLVNYPQKQRDEILDYLFKPNFGAALQILKVEIGGDGQSTDGSESSHMHYSWEENYQRGYEWWLMVEAKKRNPDIKLYGLSWAFPGWLGSSTEHSPYGNNTLTADYIVRWVNGAKKYYNLTIDYLGIWNERKYDKNYIKILRNTLDTRGFKNVRIIAADNGWEAATDVKDDSEFASAIYALGCHYPGTYAWSEATNTGKPLWASEDYSTFNDNVGAGCWARILNQNYVNGVMTATISWDLIASYYDGLPYFRDGLMSAVQPWSGNYVVESPIWITAHTTQFTSIGWQYLNHGSGVGKFSNGGSYVSFISPDKQNLTIVIETMSHDHSYCIRPFLPWFNVQPQNVVITLNDDLTHITEMDLWYSKLGFNNDNTTMFKKLETVKFVNGSAKLTLGVDEIYTLTTVKSGNKGSYPDPPAPKPFPLPYFDDFESYQIYQEPFNLAQQSGTFEVLKEDNNQFVRQTLLEMPVTWCDAETTGKGFNFIGNYSWTDIFVEIDFRCPKVNASSGVFLAARVDQGGCDANKAKGIYFTMFCNGAYRIDTEINAINSRYHGSVLFSKAWNKISLLAKGSNILGAVNGVGAFNYSVPEMLPNGFVAMGTHTFAFADFDNLHLASIEDGLAIMESYFDTPHPEPLYFEQEQKWSH